MGFFTDAIQSAKEDVAKLYKQNQDIITGSTAGAIREDKANADIAASKGGYLNSPLGATLAAKNAAVFNAGKNNALAKLAAENTQNLMTLNREGVNAKLQDKTAENAMWANIITGAGGILGTVLGGPMGGTIGTAAAKAVTGAATNYDPAEVNALGSEEAAKNKYGASSRYAPTTN